MFYLMCYTKLEPSSDLFPSPQSDKSITKVKVESAISCSWFTTSNPLSQQRDGLLVVQLSLDDETKMRLGKSIIRLKRNNLNEKSNISMTDAN